MVNQITQVYLLGSILLLVSLLAFFNGTIGIASFGTLFFGVTGFVVGFRAGKGVE